MNRKQAIKHFSNIDCNTTHELPKRAMDLIKAEIFLNGGTIKGIILKALEICYGEEKE